MKLMEFKYTKANGDVSERAIVVSQEPVKNLSGIDVTELPEAEFANFCRDWRELKTRQAEEVVQLLGKHDLSHSYRQFKPESMAEVTAVWI